MYIFMIKLVLIESETFDENKFNSYRYVTVIVRHLPNFVSTKAYMKKKTA